MPLVQAATMTEAFEEGHPWPRVDHPVMTEDGRAIWHGSEGWVWVLPESDGKTFYLTLDAANPQPPWVDWIIESAGLTETLFPDCHDGLALANALLEEGIAPDQPFFIHISFSAGRDSWEFWDETDWELLAVEKLPPEEVARRWARWLEGIQAEGGPAGLP